MSKYLFSQTSLFFQNRKISISRQAYSFQMGEIRKKQDERGKRINLSIRSDKVLIDSPFFPSYQWRKNFSLKLIYFPDWLIDSHFRPQSLIGLSSANALKTWKNARENFATTCVSPFELGPHQSLSVIINCML